jgi:hypothetical protein
MTHSLLFPAGARRALWQQQLRRLARRHQLLVAALGAALLAALLSPLAFEAERIKTLLAALRFYAPLICGLAFAGGIVSDDLRNRTALLWFQQPGSLMGWYLRRYTELQLLLLGLATLCWTVLAVVGLVTDLWPVAAVLRTWLYVAIVATLAAAIVFAYSAWGVANDSFAAIITILGLLIPTALVALEQSVRATILKAVALPIDALQVIAEGGGIYGLGTAVALCGGQIIGWTLIGALGLRMLPDRLASASINAR